MKPSTPAAVALLVELDHLTSVDWDLLFQRTDDWQKPVLPANGQRGGGGGEPSDEALVDRREDRQASRYHQEVRALVKRMTADAQRARHLAQVVNPPTIKTLPTRDMQLAQVANEGWCVSCWRDDKTCEPIGLRPSGEPWYRDLCRPCGQWKAEHGQNPPMVILQKRHAGIRVTQTDVDKALTGAGRKD